MTQQVQEAMHRQEIEFLPQGVAEAGCLGRRPLHRHDDVPKIRPLGGVGGARGGGERQDVGSLVAASVVAVEVLQPVIAGEGGES